MKSVSLVVFSTRNDRSQQRKPAPPGPRHPPSIRLSDRANSQQLISSPSSFSNRSLGPGPLPSDEAAHASPNPFPLPSYSSMRCHLCTYAVMNHSGPHPRARDSFFHRRITFSVSSFSLGPVLAFTAHIAPLIRCPQPCSSGLVPIYLRLR